MDGRLQNFRCNKLKELSIIAMFPSQSLRSFGNSFTTDSQPLQFPFVKMLINCRLSDLCSSKAVLSLAERSKKRLSELLFRVGMTLVLHPRTNSLKSFVVLA